MRKITITLFACLVALTTFAGPVSRQQAMKTAAAYMQKQRVARGVSQPVELTLAYECQPKATRGVAVNSPLYYVFNQGQQGFVVVAGDDRVKPVLGYVDNGSFAIDEANDGVRWWLGALEQTMLSVVKTKDNGQSFQVLSDNSAFKPFVEPLVKVNWGQGAPHNDRCPVDVEHGNRPSLVGCTAVAMAQVLSKWKAPAHGTGKVTYTTGTHKMKISENLSEFVFDWDNMLPFYGGGKGNAAQKAAVAELMYACGVSVRMNYCTTASGAKLMSSHFEDHFGIDEKCNIVTRHYFTKAEWDEMMKRELNEGRPVVYSGYSLDAGHAFVCDGYNKEGLFHINWGWDGSMNGYFALAELNSAVEHAGAPTDEAGSFNIDQDMVIGIQPDDGVKDEVEHSVYFNGLKNFKAMNTRSNVRLSVSTTFSDGNGFNGQFTLGIFDKEDKLITTFGQTHNLSLSGYATYSELQLGGTLPSSVKEGVYTLRPVSRANEKMPFKPAYGRKSSPYITSLTMKVISSQVRLSAPQESEAKFTVVGVKALNGKAYAGAMNGIEIKLRNDGALYNGPVVLQRQGDGGQKRVFANNYIVDQGEELVIRANIKAPASGKFDELFVWISGGDKDMFFTNGFDYKQIGSVKYELVTPTPGKPALSLTNMVLDEKTLYVGQDQLKIDFSLQNNGGFYGNDIYAYVFPSGGGNALTSTHTKVYLDKGEKTNVHLEIPVGSLSPAGYFFHIYYKNADGQLDFVSQSRFSFSIKSGANISITNNEGYGVHYVNYAFIMPEKLKGGIVNKVDANNLNVNYLYNPGDVVPACTPIVVKAERRGSYAYKSVGSEATAPEGNYLSAQFDERGYSYAGEGDFKYYDFKTDDSRANYGFYFKMPDGAPFKVNASRRVYLAVPAAQAKATGYALNAALTGIENLIEDSRVNADDAIYTLSGVRVKGDLKTLPKGLYIVGGKKVYVK